MDRLRNTITQSEILSQQFFLSFFCKTNGNFGNIPSKHVRPIKSFLVTHFYCSSRTALLIVLSTTEQLRNVSPVIIEFELRAITFNENYGENSLFHQAKPQNLEPSKSKVTFIKVPLSQLRKC